MLTACQSAGRGEASALEGTAPSCAGCRTGDASEAALLAVLRTLALRRWPGAPDSAHRQQDIA